MKYSIMASPMKIGSVEIKNRVVMTAMGVSMANLDGTPSHQMITFYEERAKGGVGLIIPEITRVNDATGATEVAQLSVSRDELIPGLKNLTDAVHKHGTKIFIQLHHPGRQTYCDLIGGQPVVAPSAIPCGVCQQETRALTIEEIKSLIQDFIAGARRAKLAGADGVEVHAAHGYLLASFLSPYSNKRTDEYGGSFKNRIRMITEIIEGIKKECGKDFPISVRVNVEEFLDEIGLAGEGIKIKEGVMMAKSFQDAGADMINVSSGIYETMNTFVEPISFEQGWRLGLSKHVKEAVSVPVIGNNVIRDPQFAEDILQKGIVDFIGMGRTHLADPEWTNKALNGRESDIRKCISCLRCFESLLVNGFKMEPLECSVNARTGKEEKYPEPLKDGTGRVVAIIGGGPTGLEAARVLAERRFKPVIFEKSGQVGGQLCFAKNPPMKEKIGWFIDYLDGQMKKFGVDVRLNTEATVEEIKNLNPYAVVVATGSKPIIPRNIPGIESDKVFIVTDILSGKIKPNGKNIAVIGSGMTGLETAEMLAEQGNNVSVIEMADTIAPGGYMQNVLDITGRLAKYNVELLPQHKLMAIEDGKIFIETKNGAKIAKETNLVVLSLGVLSENSFYEEIKDEFENVHLLGDADKIGRIVNAVLAGFEFGYNLK